MANFEQIDEIKIIDYTPSQLNTVIKSQPEIADHIIAGYGIPYTDTRSRSEIAMDEFSHGEDRTRVYLAEIGGQIVGSLYFILWKNAETDKRGGKFLEYLKINGQDVLNLDLLSKYSVIACDVGIVIDPRFHGKGVVDELYKHALDSVKPAFIVGQTKTPAAIMARSRILHKNGFETCYGGMSVTDISSEAAEVITEAYYYARQDIMVRINGKFIHYAKTEGLQPEIKVDFDRLKNEGLKFVFEEIKKADSNRPEGFITFSTLVSVNADLILNK